LRNVKVWFEKLISISTLAQSNPQFFFNLQSHQKICIKTKKTRKL
jgi:hypothetical protein